MYWQRKFSVLLLKSRRKSNENRKNFVRETDRVWFDRETGANKIWHNRSNSEDSGAEGVCRRRRLGRCPCTRPVAFVRSSPQPQRLPTSARPRCNLKQINGKRKFKTENLPERTTANRRRARAAFEMRF